MRYQDALALAIEKHKGQFRRGGEPVITHLVAVANKFKDEKRSVVAVLHDIVEETDMSVISLWKDYNLDVKSCESISLLTRKKDQDYLEYILNIMEDKVATDVKIEDIKHNLSCSPRECTKPKYRLALYILTNGEYKNDSD